MGQIFNACAYDIDAKICCVIDADKFHANCYSYSGAVCSMHYLLRQKPYRIMWGGGYVVIDDNIANFTRTEDLLGISTYEDYEDFERNNEDLESKSYYDKIKFIDDNSALWSHIDVWNEANEYFDWENTRSVKYDGYLLNHTQKLAIDLADYHRQSKYTSQQGDVMAIDAIPVLTETGGGTAMALFEGVSNDSTEELAESWCGDLMQIIGELPEGYELINCCFAEIWSQCQSCYRLFGVDEKGLVLKDASGNRYEGSALNIYGKRGKSNYIKVEEMEDRIKYVSVTVT